MNTRHIIAAALALATLSGVAHADGLQPVESRNIDLGAVSGIAYYTVERDGVRVVATLAQQGEDATPVRVEVLLGQGQSMTLSTPHGVGIAPEAVEVSRQADTVLVRKTSAAVMN